MTATAPTSLHSPSASAIARAARRRRRWPVAVLVVLGLLLGAWCWLVPKLVERALTEQLRDAGFTPVSFGELAVAFDRIDLRDLHLHHSRLGTIDMPTARASFRASDLLAGRIDTLALEQAVWTLPADGPLPPTTDAGNRVTAPNSRLPLPRELPLRRLEVLGARFVTAAGAVRPTAAIDAVLEFDGPRWLVSANGTVAAQPLHVRGQLVVGEALVNGVLDVSIPGTQPLRLHGACRLEQGDGQPVLALSLQGGEQPFDVTLAAQNVRGAGGIELRANVPLAHLDAATFGLRLADLDLTTGGLQLGRLSGQLGLQGLPQPVSDGEQRLAWQSLRFAEITAGAGEARIELRPGLVLLAQVRQLAHDDPGALEIRGVRLAPGVTEVPATVAFEEVSLREWLELLSDGRVTGEGRMTGSVDVALRTQPRLRLGLRGGQLSAVRGGLVRFLEDDTTKQLIRQQAEQIAAASGHGNVVKERIVGALEEFAYSALEFRVEPEPDGGATLAVHAAGQGRKVPQQLELDVNLRGFDAAVDTAFALKLGIDHARRRLDDKVERRPTNETETGPDGQRKR